MERLDGRRVLVTGAGGFLGRHVVERLVRDGAVVTAGVHRPAPPEAFHPSVRSVALDVTDGRAVDDAFDGAGAEALVHLAGDTSARRSGADRATVERSIEVNVRGTALVAMSAIGHGVERVVRTGGLEEYGSGPTPYVETQREEPVSPYSAGQVAATHLLRTLQRTTDRTTFVTVRPALVYGPGQPATFFIPALIDHALRGLPFAMTEGLQHRDLVYVDDVVDGIVAGLIRPVPPGTIVNLCHGVEHRILDVARMLHDLIGGGELRVGAAAPAGPDLEHLVGSPDLAAELLGWRPQVGLEDGLRRTVEWHRSGRREAVA